MTINTFEVSPLGQKYVPLSLVKTVRELSSASTLESSRRIKIKKSPYLCSDNYQMYSCFASKRTEEKKNETFSSFPTAANIYKANSAEFKKRSKRCKKTALYSESRTSAIKACTVSDMSNSEYCDHKDNEKKRVKKRKTHQTRKNLIRHNTIDIYNRDAKDLECCSSIKLVSKKQGDVPNLKDYDHELEQDVWSVLSNINKFELSRSSQEVSSKSGRSSRKNKRKKVQAATTARLPGTQLSNRNFRNPGKGRRLIETFRTEEMTVVANIEIEQHEESRTTLSPNSSYDRLTVISKEFLDKETRKADEITVKNMTTNSTKTPVATGRIQSTGGVKNKQLSITNGKGTAYTKDKQEKQKTVVNTTPKRFQTAIQSNARSLTKNSLHSNLIQVCNNKVNKNTDVISLGESENSSKHESDDEFDCFMDHTFKETTEDPRKSLPNNANKRHKNNPVGYYGDANERFIIIKHCNNLDNKVNKTTPDKHQVLTTPAAKIIPKMTINEIRKKLGLIRYPLIILNNNQLSSTIKVMDVDPPQYYGLDKHIWPFMRDWMANKTEKSEMGPENVKVDRIANNFLNLVGKVSKISKNKNMIQENPQIAPVLDKKRNTMTQIKDKVMRIWQRAPAKNSDSLNGLSSKVMSNAQSEIPNTNKKPKAMLKDNIKESENAKSYKSAAKENLATLYNRDNHKLKENVKMTNTARSNKALITGNDEMLVNIESSKDNMKKITEMNCIFRNPQVNENAANPEMRKELAEKHIRDRRHRDIMPAVLRYPWAKAKQASEFVESVLVKIKKGVYSEHECNAPIDNVTNILNNINKGVYYGDECNVSNKEVSNVLDKINKRVNYENVRKALNEEVTNVLENIKKGVYYENECNASNAQVAKVLNKLKKGVYYDNEINSLTKVNHSNKINVSVNKLASPSNNGNAQLIEFDCKDVSMQTLTWNNNKNDPCNAVKNENNQSSPDCNPSEAELESDVVIPGFEETLPQLEVETIGSNQITVRHRLQNVTVQFDIAVPSKKSRVSSITNGTESSLTKKKNRSKTQVYKCNTAILNTALPAELCTMFPALLKNMFGSGTLPETTVVDPLSIPGYENSDKDQIRRKIQFKLQTPAYRLPWFASSKIPVCPPFITSPALIEMLKGHYSSKVARLGICPLLASSKVVNRFELLRRVVVTSLDIPQSRPIVQKLVYIVVDPLQFLMPKANSADIEEPSQFINTVSDEPSDRLMTVGQSSKIVERFSSFYLSDQGYEVKETETKANGIVALQFTSGHDDTSWNYCKFNIGFTLPTFTVSQFQLVLGINTPALNLFITNLTSITTVKTALSSFDHFDTIVRMATISNSKGLEQLKSSQNCEENRFYQSKGTLQNLLHLKEKINNFDASSGCKKCNVRRESVRGSSHSSTHKKIVVGFRKFYKKCRSQLFSNRTPLDKISNIDDFIQTLGSARHLGSVFNGICGVRLMTCVEEMKKWIKAISSKQALLVLMLMSKKDTPNMIRLRPLVLQGIAMNRITRAKELEMEIEVLSRENLQITQFDRLRSTSPEPSAGCDLLEELCWIAKNTASDSQRPFDEKGIEVFLKNLLQKRKNMNPSYLRVMARYVGLGLIKGQRKG